MVFTALLTGQVLGRKREGVGGGERAENERYTNGQNGVGGGERAENERNTDGQNGIGGRERAENERHTDRQDVGKTLRWP